MVTGARYLNYGFPILRGWSLGPILVTKVQLTIVLASLSLMLAIYALLNFTKLGKAMRAVADDADLCEVSGIDSNFIIDCVFAVGSASAGAAGILMGLDTILTHTMGIQMTIKAFAAVILGGLGSVQGAVAGGFLLGIGENIGVWFLPSVWKDSIAFGIMTIGLYLKPTGLFGKAGEAMVLGK
jgi:branched-subunit amino acid ABC-type transport system permease component